MFASSDFRVNIEHSLMEASGNIGWEGGLFIFGMDVELGAEKI